MGLVLIANLVCARGIKNANGGSSSIFKVRRMSVCVEVPKGFLEFRV